MEIDSFTDEVHAALRRLYEPQFLRKSPLVSWLNIEQAGDPVRALRKTLTDAIQSLKPNPRAHLESSEYRTYQILLSRFLDQAGQKEVASDLGVSERQLRRLETDAVRTLSETLWAENASRLEKIDALPVTASSSITAPSRSEPANSENEINRLRSTFPHEKVDLKQLIFAAYRTIEPLAAQLHVQLDFHPPSQDVIVEGSVGIIRQVLLNLLAAGVHAAPEGKILLEIRISPANTAVCISAGARATDSAPLSGEIAEKIEMTNRLIAPFDGLIQLQVLQSGPGEMTATLQVPSAATINILAIEDNEDLVTLYERYLSGTNYRLVSTSDPAAVFPLIEEFSPKVIMLDVMMPACDGWEILGQLRENASTRHIPLVICSILPQESLAYALGAADTFASLSNGMRF